MELGRKRLDPALQRQWSDREAELLNRGIAPGSEQYQREQDAMYRGRNDATSKGF